MFALWLRPTFCAVKSGALGGGGGGAGIAGGFGIMKPI